MDNVNGSVDTQQQIQPQVQTQSQEASAEALQNIQEGSANNKNNNKTKNSDMILGKFKSVEDLTAAYKNMELQQGQQSKELGELRKKAELLENMQKESIEKDKTLKAAKEYFDKVIPKYQKNEYFKNPEFKELYAEAFNALGTNLDADKFVSLLDNYVAARIKMSEKAKAAKNENDNITSQMQFSNSAAKNSTKSMPKIDSLTPEQIDAYVAEHI